MKIGVDIVQISRFQKTFSRNQKYFKEKIFLFEELSDIRPEHLAGIFAAKEAIMKALGIEPGRWQEIIVSYKEEGKPFIASLPPEFENYQGDLSISHDGDYAVAFVVFQKQQ